MVWATHVYCSPSPLRSARLLCYVLAPMSVKAADGDGDSDGGDAHCKSNVYLLSSAVGYVRPRRSCLPFPAFPERAHSREPHIAIRA